MPAGLCECTMQVLLPPGTSPPQVAEAKHSRLGVAWLRFGRNRACEYRRDGSNVAQVCARWLHVTPSITVWLLALVCEHLDTPLRLIADH